MIVHMMRDMHAARIDYHFAEYPNYVGRANCTLGIARQSISLMDNSCGAQYCMRQTNPLLKLLCAVPLLGMVLYTPYYLFVNGTKKGKLSRVFFKATYHLSIDADLFELRLDKDETCLFFKNGQFIASCQKRPVSAMEHREYAITIDGALEDEIGLCLLMGMVVDIVFYPNRGQWHAIEYQRTFRLSELHRGGDRRRQ